MKIAFAEKVASAFIQGDIFLLHVALTEVVFYESFKGPCYRIVATSAWPFPPFFRFRIIFASPVFFDEWLCPPRTGGTVFTHSFLPTLGDDIS